MYENIKTREELVEAARKIEPVEKRIEFIMGYFKDDLKYNYMELLASLEIDISYKDGYKIPETIKEGSFVDEILKLAQKHKGNYEAFIEELRGISKERLRKYVKDEEQIDSNVDRFIDFFLDKTGMKDTREVSVDSEDLANISASFNELKPEIDENGILRRGVCRHFSKYLVDLMKDAGIEDVYIVGSVLEHMWMMAKIDDRYMAMDMNRLTTLRDQGKYDESALEWMHMDFGRMFELDPNRSIEVIDTVKLDVHITAENYTPELLEAAVEKVRQSGRMGNSERGEITDSSNSLGKIALAGLIEIDGKPGTTNDEVKDAEKIIETKDKEFDKDSRG